jgi:hypothetical protein
LAQPDEFLVKAPFQAVLLGPSENIGETEVRSFLRTSVQESQVALLGLQGNLLEFKWHGGLGFVFRHEHAGGHGLEWSVEKAG